MNDKQKETADTLQLCYDYCCVDEKNTLVPQQVVLDVISLLRKQELPAVKPEELEERTKKWLDKMTAKERLEEIAAILDDWDGYRTAKGLAELINEVWAYALHPVKEQDSVKPNVDIDTYVCGACGTRLERQSLIGPNAILAETFDYCPNCGKKVAWNGQLERDNKWT